MERERDGNGGIEIERYLLPSPTHTRRDTLVSQSHDQPKGKNIQIELALNARFRKQQKKSRKKSGWVLRGEKPRI